MSNSSNIGTIEDTTNIMASVFNIDSTIESYHVTDEVIIIDSSNIRLGIGIGTPKHRLDVHGDINFTGELFQDGKQFISDNNTDSHARAEIAVLDKNINELSGNITDLVNYYTAYAEQINENEKNLSALEFRCDQSFDQLESNINHLESKINTTSSSNLSISFENLKTSITASYEQLNVEFNTSSVSGQTDIFRKIEILSLSLEQFTTTLSMELLLEHAKGICSELISISNEVITISNEVTKSLNRLNSDISNFDTSLQNQLTIVEKALINLDDLYKNLPHERLTNAENGIKQTMPFYSNNSVANLIKNNINPTPPFVTPFTSIIEDVPNEKIYKFGSKNITVIDANESFMPNLKNPSQQISEISKNIINYPVSFTSNNMNVNLEFKYDNFQDIKFVKECSGRIFIVDTSGSSDLIYYSDIIGIFNLLHIEDPATSIQIFDVKVLKHSIYFLTYIKSSSEISIFKFEEPDTGLNKILFYSETTPSQYIYLSDITNGCFDLINYLDNDYFIVYLKQNWNFNFSIFYYENVINDSPNKLIPYDTLKIISKMKVYTNLNIYANSDSKPKIVYGNIKQTFYFILYNDSCYNFFKVDPNINSISPITNLDVSGDDIKGNSNIFLDAKSTLDDNSTLDNKYMYNFLCFRNSTDSPMLYYVRWIDHNQIGLTSLYLPTNPPIDTILDFQVNSENSENSENSNKILANFFTKQDTSNKYNIYECSFNNTASFKVNWDGNPLFPVTSSTPLTIEAGMITNYESTLTDVGVDFNAAVATIAVNTNTSNITVVLDQRTKVFLLREGGWASNGDLSGIDYQSNFNGWTLEASGLYLGNVYQNRTIDVYTRIYPPTAISLNDYSAFYIFQPPFNVKWDGNFLNPISFSKNLLKANANETDPQWNNVKYNSSLSDVGVDFNYAVATTEINQNDFANITVALDQSTRVFLLRKSDWGVNGTLIGISNENSGWTLQNSGNYLGQNGTIEVYTRIYPPSTTKLNSGSALYIFQPELSFNIMPLVQQTQTLKPKFYFHNESDISFILKSQNKNYEYTGIVTSNPDKKTEFLLLDISLSDKITFNNSIYLNNQIIVNRKLNFNDKFILGNINSHPPNDSIFNSGHYLSAFNNFKITIRSTFNLNMNELFLTFNKHINFLNNSIHTQLIDNNITISTKDENVIGFSLTNYHDNDAHIFIYRITFNQSNWNDYVNSDIVINIKGTFEINLVNILWLDISNTNNPNNFFPNSFIFYANERTIPTTTIFDKIGSQSPFNTSPLKEKVQQIDNPHIFWNNLSEISLSNPIQIPNIKSLSGEEIFNLDFETKGLPISNLMTYNANFEPPSFSLIDFSSSSYLGNFFEINDLELLTNHEVVNSDNLIVVGREVLDSQYIGKLIIYDISGTIATHQHEISFNELTNINSASWIEKYNKLIIGGDSSSNESLKIVNYTTSTKYLQESTSSNNNFNSIKKTVWSADLENLVIFGTTDNDQEIKYDTCINVSNDYWKTPKSFTNFSLTNIDYGHWVPEIKTFLIGGTKASSTQITIPPQFEVSSNYRHSSFQDLSTISTNDSIYKDNSTWKSIFGGIDYKYFPEISNYGVDLSHSKATVYFSTEIKDASFSFSDAPGIIFRLDVSGIPPISGLSGLNWLDISMIPSKQLLNIGGDYNLRYATSSSINNMSYNLNVQNSLYIFQSLNTISKPQIISNTAQIDICDSDYSYNLDTLQIYGIDPSHALITTSISNTTKYKTVNISDISSNYIIIYFLYLGSDTDYNIDTTVLNSNTGYTLFPNVEGGYNIPHHFSPDVSNIFNSPPDFSLNLGYYIIPYSSVLLLNTDKTLYFMQPITNVNNMENQPGVTQQLPPAKYRISENLDYTSQINKFFEKISISPYFSVHPYFSVISYNNMGTTARYKVGYFGKGNPTICYLVVKQKTIELYPEKDNKGADGGIPEYINNYQDLDILNDNYSSKNQAWMFLATFEIWNIYIYISSPPDPIIKFAPSDYLKDAFLLFNEANFYIKWNDNYLLPLTLYVLKKFPLLVDNYTINTTPPGSWNTLSISGSSVYYNLNSLGKYGIDASSAVSTYYRDTSNANPVTFSQKTVAFILVCEDWMTPGGISPIYSNNKMKLPDWPLPLDEGWKFIGRDSFFQFSPSLLNSNSITITQSQFLFSKIYEKSDTDKFNNYCAFYIFQPYKEVASEYVTAYSINSADNWVNYSLPNVQNRNVKKIQNLYSEIGGAIFTAVTFDKDEDDLTSLYVTNNKYNLPKTKKEYDDINVNCLTVNSINTAPYTPGNYQSKNLYIGYQGNCDRLSLNQNITIAAGILNMRSSLNTNSITIDESGIIIETNTEIDNYPLILRQASNLMQMSQANIDISSNKGGIFLSASTSLELKQETNSVKMNNDRVEIIGETMVELSVGTNSLTMNESEGGGSIDITSGTSDITGSLQCKSAVIDIIAGTSLELKQGTNSLTMSGGGEGGDGGITIETDTGNDNHPLKLKQGSNTIEMTQGYIILSTDNESSNSSVGLQINQPPDKGGGLDAQLSVNGSDLTTGGPLIYMQVMTVWIEADLVKISKVLTVDGNSVYSDDRIKHNEVNIVNGLNIVRQLNPQKYQKTQEMYEENYQGDISGNYRIESGFIAQDILKIEDLSYCVSGGDYIDESNNYVASKYYLSYNDIFVYAVAATKELDTIVQNQQNEISELKEQNILLKSKLNELLAIAGKATI